MENNRTTNLTFVLEEDGISFFFPLMQQGFMVKTRVGCSIRQMLCEAFHVTPEYVSGRIKTLFLNGKPVDDVDTAMIRDGSTLALSAAMPGLVGATFRCGGPLIAFRSGITHREEGTLSSSEEGLVCLKLFNLLVAEMGPAFLKHGIWFSGRDFEAFLNGLPGDFWSALVSVRKNGESIAPDSLRSLESSDVIHLKVETPDH